MQSHPLPRSYRNTRRTRRWNADQTLDALADVTDEERSAVVLLAEDNTEMRQLIAGALRATGHDVIEAHNGAFLLDRIAALMLDRARPAIDLIISDVRMPCFDGLQVLAGLRRSNWATPVILMTAFPADNVRLQAEQLDATLLEKPFSMEHLLGAVASLEDLRAHN